MGRTKGGLTTKQTPHRNRLRLLHTLTASPVKLRWSNGPGKVIHFVACSCSPKQQATSSGHLAPKQPRLARPRRAKAVSPNRGSAWLFGLPAGPAQPGGKLSRDRESFTIPLSHSCSRFNVRCRVRVWLANTAVSLSPITARYRMDTKSRGSRRPTSESFGGRSGESSDSIPLPPAVRQGGFTALAASPWKAVSYGRGHSFHPCCQSVPPRQLCYTTQRSWDSSHGPSLLIVRCQVYAPSNLGRPICHGHAATALALRELRPAQAG